MSDIIGSHDHMSEPGRFSDSSADNASKLFDEVYAHSRVSAPSLEQDVASGGSSSIASSSESERVLEFSSIYPSDFGEAAKALLSKVDTDYDGAMSKDEIESAFASTDIAGRDAIVLATINKHYSDLTLFSMQGPGDGAELVTSADIDEAGAALSLAGQYVVDPEAYSKSLLQFELEVPDYRTKAVDSRTYDSLSPLSKDFLTGNSYLKPAAVAVFDQLDQNTDGFISWDEIGQFQGVNVKYGKVQPSMLRSQLQENWDTIISASNDEWLIENNGITRADLENSFEHIDGLLPKKLYGITDSLLEHADRLSEASDVLFANESPLESIVPQGVNQEALGDCYFLGPLASLAATEVGKKKILDMITVNEADSSGRTTYTITFPADPENPVTIEAPTETELARFGGGTKYGFWAPLLEKAFGAYMARQPEHHKGLPHLAVPYGATLDDVGAILSPSDPLVSNPRTYSGGELAATIEQALAQGNFVAVSSYEHATVNGQKVPSPYSVKQLGLATNHVYGVVDYDRKAGEVTLYNPWGDGEPTVAEYSDGIDDGLFKLPLSELNARFDGMAISADSK
ncbi:MAG: hypothetical protein K2Y32_19590 [Candidatus Obscuribacterales bacterium]|nr:hypothetical protein [Candidatus Obscuribacterales bacterium]